ncbi:hypothetical protein ACWGI8_43785, partial [Streptomyces sp. NPDC054841]
YVERRTQRTQGGGERSLDCAGHVQMAAGHVPSVWRAERGGDPGRAGPCARNPGAAGPPPAHPRARRPGGQRRGGAVGPTTLARGPHPLFRTYVEENRRARAVAAVGR